MSQTPAEQREAAYARVLGEMRGGTDFARWSFPDPIARYGPPIDARSYGRMMQAVAVFAQQGDWHAAAARSIFGKVNLYATPVEAVAQVAAAITEFMSGGYTDVHRLTGPESGRYSQHAKQAMTEWQMVVLHLLFIEVKMGVTGLGSIASVGWALDRWMEETGVQVPHYFPQIRASRA